VNILVSSYCQVRTGYIRIGQDTSCYMLSQVRTGKVRLGQVRSCWDMLGLASSDYVRFVHVMSTYFRLCQVWSFKFDQVSLVEVISG
jgi:hypothetical protein